MTSQYHRLLRFDPTRTSFGRHETFPLRYSWLTKGLHALLDDPKIFESGDATITLGVGKNMVSSIKYWLQAAQIVERTPRGWYEATPVGLAVFDHEGYDPYLEDEGTIWLIHWLLATHPDLATAWYWFFNRFHKPEFTGQEVATALLDFVRRETRGKSSASTVKNDAAILLRMYVRSKGSTRTPLEEALDSPLSLLQLITAIPGTKTYRSEPALREGLPLGIFGYAVAELFLATGARAIPIQEVVYGKAGFPAIGGVFRLSETALLSKVERLVQAISGIFEVRETAGIHQIYLVGDLRPLDFLEYHYGRNPREAAA